MRRAILALAVCSATLAAATFPAGTANAFEVQGATVVLPDTVSPFDEAALNGRPGGSLNLLRDDPDSPGLPQYGNAIAIPGPGVDAPAWTYSNPLFQRR